MTTAGHADANEYPITPHHEILGSAPSSAVPYTTHAPIPDAKNDMAIVNALAELRAARKSSEGRIMAERYREPKEPPPKDSLDSRDVLMIKGMTASRKNTIKTHDRIAYVSGRPRGGVVDMFSEIPKCGGASEE